MNRKICVLVYSQFSPASKRLMEYVERLPFDLVQLTGMTLLQADCDEIRTILSGYDITSVPALIVQYFDGKMMILKDEEINKFISAVSKSVIVPKHEFQRQEIASVQSDIQQTNLQPQHGSAKVQNKQEILDLAMEMQKAREESEPKNRTIL